MKQFLILSLLCMGTAVAAQNNHYQQHHHHHAEDSTDVFFRHLNLNEVTVTGVTGDTKLKHATAPVSIVTPQMLKATASTNVIDAISRQPGISQLTTGGSISKPIIRGLGYNRVVVMSEGVRQEGQQWGDEHGVEVAGNSVHSVEILKGPASLMYGSDAMAGVVILHAQPTLADGERRALVGSEYQTNNGLFGYNLSIAGNEKGFVWDARFSQKLAHAYKNKYDGYVPGSQFRENAGRLMLGLNKEWGHSRLTWTAYHLTPGIVEGERDPETGELECSSSPTSYGKSLPFQEVKHYKLVWDNAVNLSTGYLKAIVGYQQNRRQEYEESMVRVPVLCRIRRFGAGPGDGRNGSGSPGGFGQSLPPLPDPQEIIDALRCGTGNSSQDLSFIMDETHILVFKTVMPDRRHSFVDYRREISDYLQHILSWLQERNIAAVFYIGTLQNSFSQYYYSYRHCKWLESHVSGPDEIIFFMDHLKEYFRTLVPRQELQRVFHGCESMLDKSTADQFSEMTAALEETNYNLTKAAQILYVHKNTLVYRYNKMKDYLGIDPLERSEDRTFLELLHLYLEK